MKKIKTSRHFINFLWNLLFHFYYYFLVVQLILIPILLTYWFELVMLEVSFLVFVVVVFRLFWVYIIHVSLGVIVCQVRTSCRQKNCWYLLYFEIRFQTVCEIIFTRLYESVYIYFVCVFFLFCRLKRPHLDYVCNMRDFNSYLFLLFRCIFVCLLFLLSSDWNWPMPLLRCRQYMFSDSYCSDPVNSIPTGLLSLSYYSWKIWKYNGNHWLFVVFISIFPSCLSA